MGDKNIKKETKKKKKSDVKVAAPSTYQREAMVQPEIVKKKKANVK